MLKAQRAVYSLIYRQVANEVVITRAKLFRSNRSQAMRLPKDVAFSEGVTEVAVVRDGKRRVIVPADARWDDFFEAPEWFLVPLFVIDDAVEKIKDGTITEYVYDPASARLAKHGASPQPQ